MKAMNSFETVRLSEVREVWESFSGWYWFVTEYHEGNLAFGLVKGWATEWGYFDLNELRRLKTRLMVWKVPKKNWAFCPCVVDDAVLCSRVCGGEYAQEGASPAFLPMGEKLKGGIEHNGSIEQLGNSNHVSYQGGKWLQNCSQRRVVLRL